MVRGKNAVFRQGQDIVVIFLIKAAIGSSNSNKHIE